MFTIHKNHLFEKTAAEPLRCFKVLVTPESYYEGYPMLIEDAKKEQAFFSLIRDFKYKTGQHYKEDTWGTERSLFRDANLKMFGFHSYSTIFEAIGHRDMEASDVIVEFEIPKGASYYYNPDLKLYFSKEIICIGYYPTWKMILRGIMWPFKKIAAILI